MIDFKTNCTDIKNILNKPTCIKYTNDSYLELFIPIVINYYISLRQNGFMPKECFFMKSVQSCVPPAELFGHQKVMKYRSDSKS